MHFNLFKMSGHLRVLELFSGIGGMNYALQYTEIPASVIAAVDINPAANAVYCYNHPGIEIMNKNIDNLTAYLLNTMNIQVILMSPPCQPHTRVGKQRDVKDNRSTALNRICSILGDCQTVEYILLENVKGFELSEAHKVYITTLTNASYYYREFILTPTVLGIPNTRHRYYCLARRTKDFPFKGNYLWTVLPCSRNTDNIGNQANGITPKGEISTILDIFVDDNSESEYLLDEKTLMRRISLLDIVRSDAVNTMCFTKAYTRYAEGTGSVYCPCEASYMTEILNRIHGKDVEESYELSQLKSLRLRYFTPREVAKLMCFPETFSFPPTTTKSSKYRLLGNSVNVKVVGELIKLLFQ